MKQDSLTVLDYIRTSIEILMHLKNDDDKDVSKEDARSYRLARDADGGAASDFTSTFQSIDFPPKEYEMQLQSSEAEVRNHIKVQQQLKLHIEVLQEKIDDLEKERDKQKLVKSEERRSIENRLRDEYQIQI